MDADNLHQQLDEIEAVCSMYTEEEGCFILAPSEQQALTAARQALAAVQEGKQRTHVYLSNLSGTVRLPDVLLAGQPVALRFQLPHGYPSTEPPQVTVECAAPRSVHEQLTAAMITSAADLLGGESLLLLLDRLQDEVAAVTESRQQQSIAANTGDRTVGGNPKEPLQANPATVAAITGACIAQSGAKTEQRTAGRCCGTLCRVVVWFHHIKSTEKRKHLVSWARELRIGGFSKPGFPGVLICEGTKPDVREYLARIRALQWQAMQVRGELTAYCSGCQGSSDSNSPRQAQQHDGSSCQRSHTADAGRVLPAKFVELPETGMSELGQYCRDAGVEGLFLAALKIQR